MTKKQYEALTWAESKFTLAVTQGYVHITRTEFDKVSTIYEEMYGETVTRSQKACPRCVLRIMQRIGKDYLTYKEKLEKKKEKKQDGGDQG